MPRNNYRAVLSLPRAAAACVAGHQAQRGVAQNCLAALVDNCIARPDQSADEVTAAVHPFLVDLAEQTQETILLSAIHGTEVIYWMPSNRSCRFATLRRPGGVAPAMPPRAARRSWRK